MCILISMWVCAVGVFYLCERVRQRDTHTAKTIWSTSILYFVLRLQPQVFSAWYVLSANLGRIKFVSVNVCMCARFSPVSSKVWRGSRESLFIFFVCCVCVSTRGGIYARNTQNIYFMRAILLFFLCIVHTRSSSVNTVQIFACFWPRRVWLRIAQCLCDNYLNKLCVCACERRVMPGISWSVRVRVRSVV